MEQLTGYPPSDFLNNNVRTFASLIHPEDQKKVTDILLDSIFKNRPYTLEYRMIGQANQIKWVLESGQQMLNEQGQTLIDGMIFDITERKETEAERHRLQMEYTAAARRAGMAEMATEVLHNVGNVLNSVNVSANVIQQKTCQSELGNLKQLRDLVQEHDNDFQNFIATDQRGKIFPRYFAQIVSQMEMEEDTVLGEIKDLTKNIAHVKEIISVQQSYATLSGLTETVFLDELCRDATTTVSGSFKRFSIELVEDFEQVPSVVTDKHKVLQILVNLLANAKDAVNSQSNRNKLITSDYTAGTEAPLSKSLTMEQVSRNPN